MKNFLLYLTESYKHGKVLYHATNKEFDQFDVTKGDLGTHLGTLEQATHVLKNRLNGNGHIYKVKLNDVYNPLRLKDVGSFHADNIADQLLKKKLITKETHEKYTDKDAWKHRHEYNQEVRNTLLKHGYDGVSYSNTHEGKGNSFIGISPEHMKIIGKVVD